MRGYTTDPVTGIKSRFFAVEDGLLLHDLDYNEDDASSSAHFSAIDASCVDWDNCPPRKWVYGKSLLRGQVSVLTGPGGVGKTSYVTSVCISLATGCNLLDPSNTSPDFKLHSDGPLRVYCYNLEDDLDETKRRFRAVLNFHRKTPSNLFGRMSFGDGTVNRLIVAATAPPSYTADGKLVSPATSRTEYVDQLIAYLIEMGIDVLSLDPLVKAHKLNENDNNQMDEVMTILKEVAVRANCAIWIVHHSGKGGAAFDVNASRGASAITAAARVSGSLFRATLDQRKAFGLTGNVVRLETTKANLSPLDTEGGNYFELLSHPVKNGTPECPDGDHAQVMRLIKLKTVTERMHRAVFEGLCDALRCAPPTDQLSGWVYDPRHDNFVGHAMTSVGITSAIEHKHLLKAWRGNGMLIADDDVKDKRGRRAASGIRLNEAQAAHMLATIYGEEKAA